MSSSWHQGIFEPINKNKCMNAKPIRYMSGWERRIMQILDTNPCVIRWSSENIPIPYYHPIKKKECIYLPDLYVEIKDAKGIVHKYMYEVKPAKEAFTSRAKTRYDKISLLVNMFKWKEAQKFCKRYGITFKILTEEQLFSI